MEPLSDGMERPSGPCRLTPTRFRGESCHEVVSGRDQFGNVHRGRDCPIRRMARRGISIFSFRLVLADRAGGCLPFNISIVVVEGGPDRDPSLVHLLEPIFGEPEGRLGLEHHLLQQDGTWHPYM